MKDYTGKYKTQKLVEWYLEQGKCPVCTMLLTSKFHITCVYLTDPERMNKTIDTPEEPIA